MASRWVTFVMIVFLIPAGSTFAQSPDTVTVANESGNPNGVIIWGDEDRDGIVDWDRDVDHLEFEGSGSIPVGGLSSDKLNQVVAFTVGRPPALKTGVTWGSGVDDVSLAYSPVYKIPIKFWILCAKDRCKDGISGNKRGHLAAFLLWANKRLRAERTGLELKAPDDGSYIVDLTGDTAPVLPLNFRTGIPEDEQQQQAEVPNDCPKLEDPGFTPKTGGAFNVYMVESVDGEFDRGDSCWTDDSVVVGRDAIWGTILHELSHDLSLRHVDLEDWVSQVGGTRNLMHSESTRRRYLTEGQVFRMHFSTHSGLNGHLASSRPQTPAQNQNQTQDQGPPRDCGNNPGANLTCPPEQTILWADW
jgi:hypothetical protein